MNGKNIEKYGIEHITEHNKSIKVTEKNQRRIIINIDLHFHQSFNIIIFFVSDKKGKKIKQTSLMKNQQNFLYKKKLSYKVITARA